MNIENDTKEPDKILNVRQAEVEKQLKYLGTIKPKRGHTLFEVNLKTSKISIAIFEITEIPFSEAKKAKPMLKRKVIKKENCLYIPALNIKNVYKILERDFGITTS